MVPYLFKLHHHKNTTEEQTHRTIFIQVTPVGYHLKNNTE